MKLSPGFPLSVPLEPQPGGKILLLVTLVVGGKCSAGGNFESVSNLPLLLPLLVNLPTITTAEARVSAKEREGTAGGEKVGPLIRLKVAGNRVYTEQRIS